MQKIKKGFVDSADSSRWQVQNQQKKMLFHMVYSLGANSFSWDIMDAKFYMGTCEYYESYRI